MTTKNIIKKVSKSNNINNVFGKKKNLEEQKYFSSFLIKKNIIFKIIKFDTNTLF
jgi:hypothetical protein